MKTPAAIVSISIHALLVIPAAVTYLAIDPTADANIGKGFLALYLFIAGLPWSPALFVLDPSSANFTSTSDAVRIGAALLTLAIHAAWAYRRFSASASPKPAAH